LSQAGWQSIGPGWQSLDRIECGDFIIDVTALDPFGAAPLLVVPRTDTRYKKAIAMLPCPRTCLATRGSRHLATMAGDTPHRTRRHR